MGNRADGRLEGVTQKAEAELKEEAAQLQGMQERAPVAWTAVGRSLEHSARMAGSAAEQRLELESRRVANSIGSGVGFGAAERGGGLLGARARLGLAEGASTPTAAPKEQSEGPDSVMSRTDSLLARLEVGSHDYKAMRKAIAEARRSFDYLQKSHPEWIANSFSQEATIKDLTTERFAKCGASYVADARRSVERYDRFIEKQGSVLSGTSGYPPDPDVVAWCALSVLDDTRAAKQRMAEKRAAEVAAGGDVAAASKFKGTSGKGFVKGLGKASKAFGAPFGEDVLKSQVVEMATKKPSDAASVASEESHMGVFAQCWFEQLGGGANPSDDVMLDEQQVDFAQTFAVMGITGLRDVEGLRSRVAVSDTGVALHTDGPFEDFAILHCTAGKSSRHVDAQPFDAACPAKGFTPVFGKWFLSWVQAREGKPFIFRKFKTTASGRRVWAVPEEVADSGQVTAMWYELLGISPLSFSEAVCKSIRLTPYATRHLLPDVARALGWPIEDRCELGRWSVSIIKEIIMASRPPAAKRVKSAKTACANLYSRGQAALERELELRSAAVEAVAVFAGAGKGDAGWTKRVPVQEDAPSFGFLKSKSATEEVEFSGQSSDDDDE